MIDGDRASENDIVLAFLRAEINSTKPDVRELYAHCLGRWRLDRVSLIDQGDLADEDANRNRKNVLGCARGFGLGKSLFRGFPTDTAWRRVRVEPSDYHRLKCISGDGDWDKLTSRTRLIQEAARNLAAVSHHRTARIGATLGVVSFAYS